MFNPLLTISDDARLILWTLVFKPGYDVPKRLRTELIQAGLIMQGRIWLEPTRKACAHLGQLQRNGNSISETGSIEYTA